MLHLEASIDYQHNIIGRRRKKTCLPDIFKQACSATKDNQKTEISLVAIVDMILFIK